LKPDLVFYENLEAVGFFSNIVSRQLPTSKQVYDAHNIDSELWTQLATAQQSSEFKNYAKNALQIETNLYKRVDAFLGCSEEDIVKLFALNQGCLPGFTIANGVDTDSKPFDYNPIKHGKKEILFCGSLDYYPNEEGFIWFYEHVFPLIKKTIPEVVLTLVGAFAKKERHQGLLDDPSVHVKGSVADVQPFYYQAGVCIAPLLSGSGTRLKILEAMSFGNPIVSTSVGAEGINFIKGKHLLVADEPNTFASRIVDLLQNHVLFDKSRFDARELDYSWGKIGTDLNKVLNQVINPLNVKKNDNVYSDELFE
jgi:glycosyltransferase involved in cell wall biosynthesis